MESDLKALSHNPTDGSFVALVENNLDYATNQEVIVHEDGSAFVASIL